MSHTKMLESLKKLKQKIEEMSPAEVSEMADRYAPKDCSQYATMEKLLLGKEIYICADCRKQYDEAQSAMTCCIKEEDDCRVSDFEIVTLGAPTKNLH